MHGGDGSINEVVNGVMSRTAWADWSTDRLGWPAGRRPAGPAADRDYTGRGANVLARALGLPLDAAAAIRRLREPSRPAATGRSGSGWPGTGTSRSARAWAGTPRWWGKSTGCAPQGRRESVTLFLRTMVRQYYRGTDRRRPALTLERDGEPPISGLFMTIITNRSPWTYFAAARCCPFLIRISTRGSTCWRCAGSG